MEVSTPSSVAVPFLSSEVASLVSLSATATLDRVSLSSPQSEKLKLDVALEGMNLSDRPT
jgi:hypothetical protein